MTEQNRQSLPQLEALFRRPGTVQYLSDPSGRQNFEPAYLAVRKAEQRIYDDAQVRRLPEVDPAYRHAREWTLRRDSLARLLADLQQGGAAHTILDLGCGNGWMTHRLGALPGCRVLGLDLNAHELEQAARVFADQPQLAFAYGDIFEDILPPASFTRIILASCIQYFPDLPALIARLLRLLTPGGELHILDSPLYTPQTIEAARRRTREYYAGMGFSEMAGFYFHHQQNELARFRPQVCYDPASWGQKLSRRLGGRTGSPFVWLKISAGEAGR